jgi:polysaccharide export outer membrane protein
LLFITRRLSLLVVCISVAIRIARSNEQKTSFLGFLVKNLIKFLLIATSAAAVGCTIIPGINISADDGEGVARKETVSDSEEIYYLKDKSGIIQAIRIITLTPGTLVKEATSSAALGPVLPQLDPGALPSEYKVGPGDILQIVVWEHPELTSPSGVSVGGTGPGAAPSSVISGGGGAGRLVAADGTMYYPYVGTFKAAGMSVVELRKFLISSLTRVIPKPQVDVQVAAFRSQRVQVAGEVRSPGVVVLDDTPKGLMEAIGERGGLNDVSSRRRVEITRAGQRYDVNLGALLSGGSAALNPSLMPGDIIRVPDHSDDQISVLGEVKKEGPVYLRAQHTTLTEALSSAEGLDKLRSNASGVLVFRRPSDDSGIATVYRVDLSSPVGLLVAGEFGLQSRDVVYVSTTAFAKYNSIIGELLPTISAVFQLNSLIRR